VRYYLILTLFLITSSGYAQNYAFLQWTVADGLPGNEVTALAEDENGYLYSLTEVRSRHSSMLRAISFVRSATTAKASSSLKPRPGKLR